MPPLNDARDIMRSQYEPQLQPLNDEEVEAFFNDIDQDRDGYVTFDELQARLEKVHQEIAPVPKKHHLHYPEQQQQQQRRLQEPPSHVTSTESDDPEHGGLHAFLCHLMPNCGSRIPKATFVSLVHSWNIPSQNQTSSEDEDKKDAEYESELPLSRRVRARWSVSGPKVLFIALVVTLQLAFGLWQMVKYIQSPLAREALGWGVVLAKASAGALYPTLFFVILSMSRWFATYMRRYRRISRFINWDFSQAFHIYIACSGLALATIHAIGHLTGTFLYGSRPAQQDNLAVLIGQSAVPKPYIGFIRTRPGWTGITAIGLYWIIAILSAPQVRRRSYEAFQLAHLLMYPLIAFLCAHGTARILQAPMMGYWLAFPTLLVLLERVHRVARGLVPVQARVEILDDDTVAFTCKHPRAKDWRYQAGQYVFLQIPSLSKVQWHPYTVSACRGSELQLHIKTDGNWTQTLRHLPTKSDVRVGIDGPFGAPAQRFYDFDKSLIIGAGVGITPFSAVLTDLEQKLSEGVDPWRAYEQSRGKTRTPTSVNNDDGDKTTAASATCRRVDFHWLVRDKEYLLWFSSLLNRAHSLSQQQQEETQGLSPMSRADEKPPHLPPPPSLILNITPHITQKRKNISTHAFRYLLDRYRTASSPTSALTGLTVASHFGRPDFDGILTQFWEDLKAEGWEGRVDDKHDRKTRKEVGVFFCGAPAIGRVLSDTCEQLTLRSRQEDGSGGVRFVFIMEVFG